MRVLVVEDDEVLLEGLKIGLSLVGFAADAVETLADADLAIATTDYDAVVLDIALPDGSGLDLLRTWRARGVATPVLLLTARNSVEDRVEGLDIGADDYLGKPFDLAELAARLRALSRRRAGRASATLKWRNIVVDVARRVVEAEGEAIDLTRREFAVFHALLERQGQVLSKNQLEERLYGWQEEIESNAIEVHIHKLRVKLGRDVIETVRGEGYRVPRR
ncbi:response regulator [Sphingomonas sp. BE137]|jgi:two-component system response regulator QseB|uniref:response regulator n=1 Tax=Sphingomonas sp. BE137 TaxID=2817844 RepID=UPI001AE5C250|nr:response regulator [Sphingomonas sp. BE137]MDR6846915.1 two-component system response regulator QseB [Sphingomonas sp. BE137]